MARRQYTDAPSYLAARLSSCRHVVLYLNYHQLQENSRVARVWKTPCIVITPYSETGSVS